MGLENLMQNAQPTTPQNDYPQSVVAPQVTPPYIQPGMAPQPAQYDQSGMASQTAQYGQSGMAPQGAPYGQPGMAPQTSQYGQPGMAPQTSQYGQPGMAPQTSQYGQPGMAPQTTQYGQPGMAPQPAPYGQPGMAPQSAPYGQPTMVAEPITQPVVLQKAEETALAPAPKTPEQLLAIPDDYYASLTPAEQQQLQTMASAINISDKAQVIAYGSEQEASLSKFADTMLKGTGSEAIGEAGPLLNQAMAQLRGYETEIDGKGGILTFFRKKKNEIAAIKDKYTSTDKKIDMIVANLNSKSTEIQKLSREFDGMFEENKKGYLYLTQAIVAGEIAMQNAQQQLLNLQSNPNADPQDVRDFDDSIKRFDRRLTNLKYARSLAISTAPQIRNVQSSADRVLETIQQLITISIPAWKTQMAIALGMRTVKSGLEIANAVNSVTDGLILAVSEEGKNLSIESAKAQERGVIQIETLRTVNNNLIEAFVTTTEIANAAVEERKQNCLELKNMENNLRNAIKKIK